MDRLRGRFEEVVRELGLLSRQEAVPPRPAMVPARPPAGSPPRRLLPDREGADAEPHATASHAPGPNPHPAPPTRSGKADVRAALGSRAALRQAFLLREILGPPRALQDPRGER